ncbi:YlbE-like family protein [Cytobacillus sp. Hz8]|uniref:YlbE-like family protein n=1 Tax=Cytobacillus sp. Hz8 TaxID=3347168 RepID=UPI0035D6DAE5
MRKEVMNYIYQEKELKQFLREQSRWYRELSRNPNKLQAFEIASLHYYKKTIPHQVEKITSGVQMASVMMSMFQAMNKPS